MPELTSPEKWSTKLVSNLLYYQTNYFVGALIIFLLACFFSPGKMFLALLTMAIGNFNDNNPVKQGKIFVFPVQSNFICV